MPNKKIIISHEIENLKEIKDLKGLGNYISTLSEELKKGGVTG